MEEDSGIFEMVFGEADFDVSRVEELFRRICRRYWLIHNDVQLHRPKLRWDQRSYPFMCFNGVPLVENKTGGLLRMDEILLLKKGSSCRNKP